MPPVARGLPHLCFLHKRKTALKGVIAVACDFSEGLSFVPQGKSLINRGLKVCRVAGSEGFALMQGVEPFFCNHAKDAAGEGTFAMRRISSRDDQLYSSFLMPYFFIFL